MLFPLLLAALVGASSEAQAGASRRRVHELRGRLGMREAAAPPGGVFRRIQWGVDLVDGKANKDMVYGVGVRLFRQRNGEDPTPESRDLAVEHVIAWWARLVKRGVLISDLPWEEEWRRTLFELNDTMEDLVLIRTPYATSGSFLLVCEEMRRKRAPDHAYLFIKHIPGRVNHTESWQVVSPTSPLFLDVMLTRVCKGDACGEMNGRHLLVYVMLPRIVDWVEQTHPDLNRFSLSQAYAAALAWHQSFGNPVRAGSPVPLQQGDEVLATFPDGARLVSLRTKRSLEEEGESMQHCVRGYWPRVRNGETLIWSYRDANQIPVLTMELAPNNLGRRQIHGFEDAEVTSSALKKSPALAQAALRSAAVWLERALPPEEAWSLERLDKDGPARTLVPVKVELSFFGLPNLTLLSKEILALRSFLADESRRPEWDAVVDTMKRGETGWEDKVRTAPILLDLRRLNQGVGYIETWEKGSSRGVGQLAVSLPTFSLVVRGEKDAGGFLHRSEITLEMTVALSTRWSTVPVHGFGTSMSDVLRDLTAQLKARLSAPTVLPDLSQFSLRAWFAAEAERRGVAWP